jgi:Tol biopolymer transport system component
LTGALLCGAATGQSTVRVSTGPTQFQGNYHSFWGALSADGRYVAFESFASNLVLSDLNFHVPDIFVKDRQTGDTTLVSTDSAGVQGNSGSIAPSISADGRWVAFESDALNLVPADANAVRDIFVHDQQTGATIRASTSSAGLEADGPSYYAVISADGRFVAFESDATQLASNDVNGVRDVFVKELTSGATVRVSTDSTGVEGNGQSTWPSISADGRYIAFASEASNLVTGDTNGIADVFVKDMLTGVTVRASVSSAGAQGDLISGSPTISGDGRWLAFASDATDLVTGDTNLMGDVFLRDMQSGATTRVSVSSAGLQADGASLVQGSYQISSDGRFVAFDSTASNLVAGDTNGASDCFVHDRLTGDTTRVDVSTSGAQSNSAARAPAISSDGRYVVFESSATNLVLGDNNLSWDVFLRDRGAPVATPFCFGDGSSAVCPCGNGGAIGNGCASSLNPSGANVGSTGTASIAADTIVLFGAGMPDSSVLYYQGTTQLDVAFGDGKRCVGGTVIRLGTKTNVAGQSHYPAAGDMPVSVRGACSAGDVRLYQCWYRNAAAGFCTPSTFNLTNGLSMTWTL